MNGTSNWRRSLLLTAACVTGALWQFLLAAFAVVVALGNIATSTGDGLGFDGHGGAADGIDCLSTSVDGDSVESKLDTLSCIGLHTSSDTWANEADYLSDCMSLSRPQSPGVADELTCAWLRPGNWRCSMLPFVRSKTLLAACRRHDLNYSTLQSLSGNGGSHKSASVDMKPFFLRYLDGEEGFHRLDEYWNPRNKHLADARFREDIRELSRNVIWPVNRIGVSVSGLLHWYANKANNKTWPVTVHDVEDTRKHPYFRMCDVPKVEDVRISSRGRTVNVEWTYDPGCIVEIEAHSYRTCWKVDLPSHLYVVYPRALASFCQISDTVSARAEFTVPPTIFGWRSVRLISVEVRPDEIVYGGPIGSETILGNRLLDRVFGGAYYPAQQLNLAVSQ